MIIQHNFSAEINEIWYLTGSVATGIAFLTE